LNRRAIIRSTVVLVAVATLAAACGGGGGGSTTSAPSAPSVIPSTTGGAVSTTPVPASGAVAGTWNGTYESTSDPAATGTFTIEFTQTGPTLTGTISVQNTPCITEGTITGSLNGDKIAFGAVKGATQTIAYTGTVSGDRMSGTYSAPACGNATGTWKAARR